MGDIFGVHVDPSKEIIVGREENTLTQADARLDRKEQTHTNRLKIEAQHHSAMIGLQRPLMEMEYQPNGDLGLAPSSFSFRMGPTSPKLP